MLIFFLATNFAFSQDINVAQKIINKSLISPAYIGNSNNSELFAGYLKSWIGVSGSPSVAFINFNSPIFEKYAVGINIFDSKEGNFNKFKTQFSGSIKFKLNEKSNLIFGLGVNLLHVYYDFSNAKSQGIDPVFSNLNSLKTNIFDADAGILYSRNKLSFGISSTSILQSDGKFIGTQGNFSQLRIYGSSFSYFFDIGKDFFVEPIIFLSFDDNQTENKFNIENSVLISFKNKIHLSLSLKQLSSFSVGFGGAVSDNFLINYNFETSSKGVLGISSGTHEINLGILINRKSGFSRSDIFPVTRNQLIEENYEIEIQNLKKEIENLKTHFNKTISIQNDRIIEAENRKKSESNLKNVTENVWADSIVYENIKFAVNTNLLFESSESELRILVVKMIKNPSLTIKIYCDVRNSGSPIFLNNLKQKRSQSIKNLLIEKGIIESRIIICRGIVDENENVKILFSEKI